MRYEDILKKIAERENVSVDDVEKEMKLAIAYSGLNCSVDEFIKTTASLIAQKDYI